MKKGDTMGRVSKKVKKEIIVKVQAGGPVAELEQQYGISIKIVSRVLEQ